MEKTGSTAPVKSVPPPQPSKIKDWQRFEKFIDRNGDKTQKELAQLWGGVSDHTIAQKSLRSLRSTLSGDRGKVVEIDTDGKVTTILDGNQVDGVELLVNLTVGTDGLVYVAGRGDGPNSTIFQIDLEGEAVDIPEPNNAYGVLVWGLLGTLSCAFKTARKQANFTP